MKEFLSFRLDEENECLLRGEQRIQLPPKVYALLNCLLNKPGRLVTHKELTEQLWPNTHVQPEVLKSYIRDLRAILEDDARTPRFIETLHRRGYRFIASVSTRSEHAIAWNPQIPSCKGNANLERMLEIFHAAVHGEPQIVFVTGEIGAGKTELCNRFERDVQDECDVSIARCQCTEGYAFHEPYFPLLEAIGSLLKGPEKETVTKVLAERAPSLFVRFPALARHPLSAQAREGAIAVGAESMLRELCDALEQIALKVPLVMILENIHWADPHTVDWIGHMARLKRPARLMAIATLREPDLILSRNGLAPLFRDLLARRLCTEVCVHPLSEDGIRTMLQEMSPGATITVELVQFLHDYSEGNPLYAQAALKHLTDSSALVGHNKGWEILSPLEDFAHAVPETICQMLEARLESLCTEEERIVMETASVCGSSWASDLVAFLTGMSTERVEEISIGLARRKFALNSIETMKKPSGAFVAFKFKHSLYRQVLYRRLSKARRARLHERVRRFLVSTHMGRLEEVASQLVFHTEMSRDCELQERGPIVLDESHLTKLDPPQPTDV